MRYLTKLVLMVLLLLPVSVWAAGKCSKVKADGDFSVTVTIAEYDPNQTYDLVVEPVGNSGDDIKVWSNQYDPNDPALINPNNNNLLFVDGKKYQVRFNYVAETSNSGTITYYLKQGTSELWTEVGSAELTIPNNSQNDVTVSGDANIACSKEIPDTPVVPDFDVCDYFPEPAQSWITEGTNDYSSYPQSQLIMSNGKQGQSIIGWSGGYVQDNYIEGGYTDGEYGTIDVLKVGFDQTSDVSNLHAPGTCESAPCDTGGEDVDTRKIIPPVLLNANFPADGSADVDISPPYNPGQGYEMCDTSELCTRTTDSTGTTVIIDQDIRKLTVASYNGEHYTIILDGEKTIKNLDVNSRNVDVVFKANSIITVNTATFTQSPTIIFEDNIRVNIQTSWTFTNSTGFEYADGADSSLLYGPEATITISNPNMDYYGYILAKNVILNNNINIYGAVTANKLQMDTAGSHIISAGRCSEVTPSSNYFIDVTPDNQFALLCEAPEITFTVLNEDGSVATDYDGTITANYPTGLTPLNPTTGTQNSEYVYTPAQGQVAVPIQSDSLQEYTVNAELTDDSDASDSGNVLFGPYKFSADPVKAVAGHPTQFDVQVLACKDDEVTEVQGYNGDKDLTVSEINLTKPTAADGAVDGDLEVSATQSGGYSNSDVTLNFSDDAKSQAYLKYNESGSLNFTLTDPEFVCPPEYDGCEVTNDDGTSENITSLQGIVNVDVRPWTFAICDENGGSNLPSGNSDGGDKFIAAGDKFSLQVKPIVWQDGGSLNGDIDVSGYCNATVTQNFLLSNAQPATVLMASTLATPAQGRLGSGIQADEDGSLERAHDDAVLNSGDAHYSYVDLTWQEVGSLNITADTNSDDYLGMNINQGYREIGRFYPHHFRLENDNVWDYADGHHDFAYMNQPIPMDYRVKAKSATDSDTENYGYFTNSLKADFVVEAIEREIVFGAGVDGESLNNRLSSGENQNSNNWDKATYTFNSNDFMFLKFSVNTDPYLTTPDGPYNRDNALFGVGVDAGNVTYENQDELNFESEFVDTNTFTAEDSLDGIAVSFFHQPEFRYGRMVLDAVSGPIGGPISVPLRVEYWDGASFVVNSDDNGSQFKTDVYYVMSNFDNSSAKLNSSASSSFITVANGKSSRVQAEQITAQREQVRLFLRQGNNSSGFGNNSEPEADDSLNATNDGWKNSEDIDQPWLQFNWRDKGDEDPSTVVNFGAYRGNDRIIFRGESNLTGG